jgi:general secretion pathway protein G
MKQARGFTLIELAVTVAIVALLSTVALPLVELTVKRAKEQELRSALREIRTGLDAYKLASDEGRIATEVDASGYPPTLEALVEGVEDARDPEAARIYFLRRIPRDPLFPDATVPAAETWGLRSYESPPEDPQPGEDVYDVRSLSEATALDGSLYRDW